MRAGRQNHYSPAVRYPQDWKLEDWRLELSTMHDRLEARLVRRFLQGRNAFSTRLGQPAGGGGKFLVAVDEAVLEEVIDRRGQDSFSRTIQGMQLEDLRAVHVA